MRRGYATGDTGVVPASEAPLPAHGSGVPRVAQSAGLPRIDYGSAALADLMPAVLAGLGVAGERANLGLTDLRRVVVLLVDGLGARALRAHPDAAPFLSSLVDRDLTVGFPTTTATSLTSLGTGVPAGEHGVTGYTSWVSEVDTSVNWLHWSPVGRHEDLRRRLVPEATQPLPTVFQRAAADGVAVATTGPASFVGTGLTRAVFRGAADATSVAPGDAVARVADAVRRGDSSLVYAYASELDLVGHVRGPGTDAWCEQLAAVDEHARRIAERLPSDATLLVTADHGMVAIDPAQVTDLDSSPELRRGVLAVAGDPRARHVHAEPGAAADVLATWRGVLGERAWVGTREDVVAAGLLGPVVTPTARARTGDVVAIADGPSAVVQRHVEPGLSALPGQHGALSPDELLVPLLRHG